jgi:hypothetical protein
LAQPSHSASVMGFPRHSGACRPRDPHGPEERITAFRESVCNQRPGWLRCSPLGQGLLNLFGWRGAS